jgi:hypothetical protein
MTYIYIHLNYMSCINYRWSSRYILFIYHHKIKIYHASPFQITNTIHVPVCSMDYRKSFRFSSFFSFSLMFSRSLPRLLYPLLHFVTKILVAIVDAVYVQIHQIHPVGRHHRFPLIQQ